MQRFLFFVDRNFTISAETSQLTDTLLGVHCHILKDIFYFPL